MLKIENENLHFKCMAQNTENDSIGKVKLRLPERIYNPITAMGFSAMFTFQLDNTKR